MEGRLIGEGPSTGVSFPDLKKIAKAYGISYVKISRLGELENKLDQLRALPGPVICEVMTPSRQVVIIGSGFGGIRAAKRLAKEPKKRRQEALRELTRKGKPAKRYSSEKLSDSSDR